MVRPLRERFDPELGRVILKLHGTDFLLKKWAVPTTPRAAA